MDDDGDTDTDADDLSETLDDIVPGRLVGHIASALGEFDSFRLPYEATVYEDGQIDREALATVEAARIKSESIYGTAHVEVDEATDEDGDPTRVVVRVADPTEISRDVDA